MRPSRGATSVLSAIWTCRADIVLGGVERVLRHEDPGLRGIVGGDGRIELLLALVRDRLRGPAVLQKLPGAVHFPFSEDLLGLLLGEVGLGLVDNPLRLPGLCLRLRERLFDIPCVHPGHDLSGRHHIADIDQEFGDASRIFGVDIDLVGFDPAIADTDADRQGRMRPFPDGVTTPSCADHNNE